MKPVEFKRWFHDSCSLLLKHTHVSLFVRTNKCPLYLCLFQIRGRHFMFHDMLWLTDPCLNLHACTHTPSVFVIQGTQVFMVASVLHFLPCNIKTLETSTSILCMQNGLFMSQFLYHHVFHSNASTTVRLCEYKTFCWNYQEISVKLDLVLIK